MASGNAEGGFLLSRIVCRMDWVPDGQSHIDDLIEFEARVNDVWCRHDDAVICTYRLSKFSGDAVIDICARIRWSSSAAFPSTIRSLCRRESSCVKYAHGGQGSLRCPRRRADHESATRTSRRRDQRPAFNVALMI